MARRPTHELAFTALRIEGGLLAPDFLDKIAHLDAAGQTESDYDIPRGLKLRDEIGRYWKIAQNLWKDFDAARGRVDLDAHKLSAEDFLQPFCRQVLGMADLKAVGQVTLDERLFPLGYAALDGRLPTVFAAHDQDLDRPSPRHGDGTRRRSPFLLAQEYLNADAGSLWALVSNGLRLRILRDNPSLTRPAYIEADLEAIFTEGLYPDFTALWLLAHGTRFGKPDTDPADCPLERWRNTAQEEGIRVRDRLRNGVTEALRSLGTGFLAHPDNAVLRQRLETGELGTQAYFEQLLRLIYRFIFLATIEDRELVFAPDASPEARQRYQAGYALARLRTLAARRRSYDRHSDLWQLLGITFRGLGQGQPALGLPALGGLFDARQCPDLEGAALDNQSLLGAIFSLCFFREEAALTRVNYRDMDSEELGSVYESLLELVPLVSLGSGARRFGFVGDDEVAATRGHARKLTGSYYTPDSLVQELIKSALEPVIEQTLKANPQRPVQALLDLTVCDPACGSGHFLLAAVRRLAEEVARLSAADGNPSPEDYRHALRDVVAHCIYGVDKNPMAIELARAALWLEAYTPDRPLTFLDHHLRCGDALLGVLDPAILEQGIPDKAFNALSGDDKDVVKALKKANREARKSIEKIHRSGPQHSLALTALEAPVDLDALPDDTLEAIEAKRAAFAQAEAQAAHSRARIAADLFVAAFVLPKTRSTQATVPTSQDLYLQLTGAAPRAGVAEAASQAAQAAQAFHWWQTFSQVQAKGGFDVLLGNPPWERIKLQEEEYFATRSPLVAVAQHKAERGRRIELLQEGMLLHTLYPDVEAAQGLHPPNRAEQQLYREFLVAKRTAEAASLYAHDAGRYPLTGVGDVNTYALFAETFAQLVSPQGRAGFIVPTGIATDDSTKAYFEVISQQARLVSLYDLENRDRLFPAVDSRMKFCLLTLGTAQAAEFVCFATRVEQLADPRRRFTLTPDEFRLINPNTRTCPVFRSERDAELTKKLYRAAPVLIEEEEHSNPWGFGYMTKMFDMADNSHEFVDHVVLTTNLNQRISVDCVGVDGRSYSPLYEAKYIHLYDHRWASCGQDTTDARNVLDTEKSDSNFSVVTRYWIDRERVEERLSTKEWDREWLIGWRDITNATNERTVIAGVFPRAAAAHTLRVAFLRVDPLLSGMFICCMSSLVLDYVARQKVGGTHLTVEILKQLPILHPTHFSETDIDFIVSRVLELTFTSNDIRPWAEDLGYDGPPFPWNPERRAVLRAELDAYYAKLYDLNRDELRYILDPADVMGEDYPSETFRVLKNNEIKQFGEYRTQRLVLREFDRMALAEAKGERYVSLLVPPPGEIVQPTYSTHGVLRDREDARLAGLILTMIREAGGLPRQQLTYALKLTGLATSMSAFITQEEMDMLTAFQRLHTSIFDESRVSGDRLQSMLRYFESSGAVRFEQYGASLVVIPSAPLPAGLIVDSDTSLIANILLRAGRAAVESGQAADDGRETKPPAKNA